MSLFVADVYIITSNLLTEIVAMTKRMSQPTQISMKILHDRMIAPTGLKKIMVESTDSYPSKRGGVRTAKVESVILGDFNMLLYRYADSNHRKHLLKTYLFP